MIFKVTAISLKQVLTSKGEKVKVLLAADSSVHSQAALESLLACPWPPQTCFIVLTVAETYHPHTDYWSNRSAELLKQQEAKILSDHEALAKSFAARLQERFPQAKVEEKVVQGHVVEKILSCAEQENVDLIVLGSHGLKGFTRFLLGSVSEAVASHARASVRIVRLHPGR